MPRYYFSLRDDLSVDDEEGAIFSDIEAAHAHAVILARDMAGASVTEYGRIDLLHYIQVADDNRKPVLMIEFGDVVSIQSAGSPTVHLSVPAGQPINMRAGVKRERDSEHNGPSSRLPGWLDR